MSVFKNNFHQIAFCFIFCVALFSCTEKKAITPSEPKERLLTFKDYEITEFKLYVGGPNGGRDISNEIKDPSSLFLGYYTNITKMELFKHEALKVSEDKIVELPIEYEANTFEYKVTKGDSLFRWNIYADFWQWYGFKRGNEKIEYMNSFYKFVKPRDTGGVFISGNEKGELHEKDFFNENPFRFKNLESMTSIGDTVLFCNVKYTYQFLK